MAKKKLQIFISSTYLDLEEERQAAVEAILGSKHIPAGMELFRAGNTSQWDTIKRWINESDIYMLILGGRYGSIETQSGKSYTQLEYEYAIDQGIPVYAVILTDQFLLKKAVDLTKEKVFETKNIDAYNEFKKFVETKIVKYVEDCKDIKIAIKDSISELEEQYNLVGWVRGSEIEDSTQIIKENNKLLTENEKLKSQLQKIKDEDRIGKFRFEDLKKALSKKKIKISKSLYNADEDTEINYLQLIKVFKNKMITGIENSVGMSDVDKFIFFKAAPFLIQFELLDLVKIAGVKYRRLEVTKQGREFLARLDIG
ncbi:DUF4062 domain-containing protein [Clostridium sp.]|uniref:DUF4062 domain-containing protein n=1 Tax=Clostridium sp. TaxID=1506 RepID=UPI00260F1196|nr:DUF4062 domain-containing protein [Clostridium sp.]